MEKKQYVGTKHLDKLDSALDKNQNDLVNLLIYPHANRIDEHRGASFKIVSKIPAYQPEAQGTQARGRVVWNQAYQFQPHGPSYLDPIPDPPQGGTNA